MKTKDIRNKDAESLGYLMSDMEEELFNLRAQMTTGHLKDTASVKLIKRDIARINTILHERAAAEAEAKA